MNIGATRRLNRPRACGSDAVIGQTETQAAIDLWRQVKQRAAHADYPPPVLSDGWGGHREALVQVYGQIPPYKGRGRPPTRKQPGDDWHYAQMVKQHDASRNPRGLRRRHNPGTDRETHDLC